MKNRINLIVGILLGLIFLIIWLHMVDWNILIEYFRNYDLSLIPLFSFFYILAYILRSWRWKIILKPVYNMSIFYAFKVFMSGMLVNYLIPVRAGELAKSIILKNKDQVPVSKSLPSIFIDKLTDLFPILLIIILIPLLTVQINRLLMIIIILLLLIFILLLLFVFFTVKHPQKAFNILIGIERIAPASWRPKLHQFFSDFIAGMAIMQGRIFAYMLIYLITLAAVFSEALYVYFVFKAFGAETTYFRILFGYTLMNLTYILPTPPAQIGSNQFMWVLIFSIALGIDKNLTSAAVIFSHLITSIWIFLCGIISLLALKLRFNQLVSNRK
ncbi:MAG: lysylphosphatidylglycerol synthase transmembrane domain-containing protein [Candidatus Stygibacter australis]|nr:lysylphosphatidylglycerol synthase transmembrane domain-containing protein [Candidatus Stygibacter australis]MDP8322820.1 lysylphosphatidylglycerol synthase transmembrane domain-containing protein [Candidatus Stygibacter australis]